MQKKFDKIMIILICITIYASSVFVGSPIQSNANIFIIMALTIVITYLFVQIFIIKKFKLIKGKIDFACVILAFSTSIPLIFNTYSSLYNEVIGIFKYITLLGLYIVIRDIIDRNKEYKKYIINSMIGSALFIAITGVDMLTTNIMSKVLYLLGNPQVSSGESRMMGIMGYENAFAIIMAISLILCIGRYNLTNKKIYWGLSYIFMSSLILSYSRLTFMAFVFTMLVYLIFLKDKNKRTNVIFLIVVNTLISLAFATIFQKILNSLSQSYIVWIVEGVFALISILFAELYNKLKDKIFEIKIKTYIIVIVCLSLILIIFVVIGINMTVPLKLFNSVMESGEVEYKIWNIESDKDYTLDFEILSNSLKEDGYEIEVTQRNKYFDIIETHEIQLGTFDGTKTLNIHTNDNTQSLDIKFKTKNRLYNRGLEIKDLKINDKEYALNYAYLPEKLVSKIKSISFSNKSAWERFVFIKDALKIIKENWLCGVGTDGWIYNYKFVQSYNYNTIAVHSYPIQFFLEYGVVAFGTLLYIIFLTINSAIKSLKDRNDIQLTAICGLLLLFSHSILDLELSFMNILYIMVLLFAIIDKPQKEEESSKRNMKESIISVIFMCIMLVVLHFNVADIIGEKYLENEKISEKAVNIFSKLVPYNRDYYAILVKMNKEDTYLKQLMKMDKNTNVEIKCEEILEKAEKENNISEYEAEYIYTKLTNLEYTSDCYLIVKQNEKLLKLCEIISNNDNENLQKTKKLALEYIKSNYQKNIDKIKDTEKNRLTESEVVAITSRMNDVINKSEYIY